MEINIEWIVNILVFVIALYVALVSWIGKDYVQRVKDNTVKIDKNKESISKLEGYQQVNNERFNNIKDDLTEIKADIKLLLTNNKK